MYCAHREIPHIESRQGISLLYGIDLVIQLIRAQCATLPFGFVRMGVICYRSKEANALPPIAHCALVRNFSLLNFDEREFSRPI